MNAMAQGKVVEDKTLYYQITFREEERKIECIQELMNEGTIPTIDGKSFEIIKARSMKEVRKVLITRIVLYECPHEMPDRDVYKPMEY